MKAPSRMSRRISREPELPKPPFPDRSAEILRQLAGMQMEIEHLKKAVLSGPNVQTLERDFSREFEHIKKEVKESLEKNRHAVDKMEAEVKFIRHDMTKVMGLEEQMDRLDMKGLSRDVERLKTMSHWLEGKFQVFDLDPVLDRMQELEDKIRIMKASQPIILE